MKTAFAIAIAAALLLFGRIASAHRIDEYLQATLVSFEADRLQMSMRLIPGVLVAPALIVAIDSDGDGVFSDIEQRAYAGRVLSDVALAVDGKAVQAKLVSLSFPPAAQMREGLGEIHIEYSVALPSGGGNHRLTLENHHQGRSSVYLVNALAPQDQAIRLVAQKRNARQSLYQVDYQQNSAAVTAPLDKVQLR